MAKADSAIPYEDLDDLFKQKTLEYAFQRLGELDPERPDMGAVEESTQAKIEGGQRWWQRNGARAKKFICESKTVRTAGPLTVVQAIFGALAQIFGGTLATFATVILIKQQFGKTINSLGKDAIDAWCGEMCPPKARRSKSPRKRKPKSKA
jgi:hypothetical protein